jgi:hypothetical protein
LNDLQIILSYIEMGLKEKGMEATQCLALFISSQVKAEDRPAVCSICANREKTELQAGTDWKK